jgi:3-hydroxymyristoyl/3-hydroxydecanoyl-(acyl carrier protein) dehydratase
MFELIRTIRLDGERATGTAAVAADLPMLLDHFPGRPILPGTWLVELAAQIAGPLAEAVAQTRHGVDRCALLAMIDHAKLLAPVDLPATLRLDAEVARCEPSTAAVRVVAVCEDVSVMRAVLVFALLDAPLGLEAAARARRDRLARWQQ